MPSAVNIETIGLPSIRVEPFDAMRDGIHTRGAGDFRWQRQGERGVVIDGFRQDFAIAAGLLDAIFGQAVNGCHLGARVSGRYGDDRQSAIEPDRLGESDCGAAPDGHAAIGVEPPRRSKAPTPKMTRAAG
jgi:hypothetical protein